MMSGPMPIARRVYVCDDVVRHPTSGKPMIVNLWDTVRVPTLPHTLAKLCLFAWLRDVVSDVRVRIEIDYAGPSERPVPPYKPIEHVVPAATAAARSVWAKFLIEGVRLSEFGEYIIDVFIDDELLDYQVISVKPG